MRNQVGENGESQRSESRKDAPKKPLRGESGKKEERKKQRPSSQNRNGSGRKKTEEAIIVIEKTKRIFGMTIKFIVLIYTVLMEIILF